MKPSRLQSFLIRLALLLLAAASVFAGAGNDAMAAPAVSEASAAAPAGASDPGRAQSSVGGTDAMADLVQASLVSEALSLRPGGSTRVGLRLAMKPGWHTYWRVPGDSGLATTIDWRLPAGFAAGPLDWPTPERWVSGGLASLGYGGEVVLLSRVSAPATLHAGSDAVLGAKVAWLACKDICVPGSADVSLTLAISNTGPTPDPNGSALIRGAEAALPRVAPWPVTFAAGDRTVVLHFPSAGADGADRLKSALFLPISEGVVDFAADQNLGTDAVGRTLTLARATPEPGGPASHPALRSAPALARPLEGVLLLDEDTGGAVTRTSLAIEATPGGPSPVEGIAWGMLGRALGLALLGGLILNFMPCVLPVLSLKVLGIARQVRLEMPRVRLHGWIYTAGILVSFAAIGALLGLLRFAGHEVGWGFQLQSPVFVAALAYLLLALALSMSGLFGLGGSLMGVGGSLANRPGLTGTFCSGILATLVATPCTAPFMGAALGFALTQPFPIQLLVLLSLGLGLALPYLALTHMPGLGRLLPRPGRWMLVLKHILAIPLYATVLWLVWVLSLETGRMGFSAAIAGLVLVAGAAIALGQVGARGPRSRAAIRDSAAAALAVALVLLILPARDPAMADPGVPDGVAVDGAEPFSDARLEELIAQRRPVFVDFTAAWCITCLVNEKTALASASVRQAFADRQVAYLKADWTRQSPEISRALEKYGRNGVPLYLLYDSGATAPQILPQILTVSALLEALDKI